MGSEENWWINNLSGSNILNEMNLEGKLFKNKCEVKSFVFLGIWLNWVSVD